MPFVCERSRAVTSLALGFSLLVSLAACSGGTDTVTGSGSPSGSASGTRPDGEPTRDTSDTTPAPDGAKDGEEPPPDDDPGPKDQDPDPSGPTSGVDAVIDVPQATGTSASADLVLSQTQKVPRLEVGTSNKTCPVTLSATEAPYVYVELKNAGAKRALTSVWVSPSPGGPSNTADALTIYPGATPPATDAARRQCLGILSYSCSTSPCVGWPGLSSSAGDAVEVPPKGSMLVYVQGLTAKTGSFKLNVRTDFLQ